MAFVLEPIAVNQSDAIVQMITKDGYRVSHQYSCFCSGNWAIDKNLQAVLYFAGSDMRDQWEPQSYSLKWKKLIVHFDLLDSVHSNEDDKKPLESCIF